MADAMNSFPNILLCCSVKVLNSNLFWGAVGFVSDVQSREANCWVKLMLFKEPLEMCGLTLLMKSTASNSSNCWSKIRFPRCPTGCLDALASESLLDDSKDLLCSS